MTAVTMRDLELVPCEPPQDEETLFWSGDNQEPVASGSGQPLTRTASVGPVLQAWLKSLEEEDAARPQVKITEVRSSILLSGSS